MNEGRMLTIENRKECPRDRDSGGEVTLGCRERVRRGSRLKEEPWK